MERPVDKDQINREICERLGICYEHNWIPCPYSYDEFECRECKVVANIPLPSNSDFFSKSGRIELIELMEQRKDWGEFKYYKLQMVNDDLDDFIDDYLLDDTGKLAWVCLEWLGREK